MNQADDEELLRPQEVAEMFGVRVNTVARWAREGRLMALRTPGGHRRYILSAIHSIIDARERREAEREFAEDAVRLYVQGWSIRQVARQLDSNYGAVRRLLGRHAILRSRGGR